MIPLNRKAIADSPYTAPLWLYYFIRPCAAGLPLFLFGAAAAAALPALHVFLQGALGHPLGSVQAFVYHAPEAIGQVIPVSPVYHHALKALSVMGAVIGAVAVILSACYISPMASILSFYCS